MKKWIFFGVIIPMALGILTGCAGNKELIRAMSTSTTQNIFQETEDKTPLANGYADLRISSSLKTHHPGIYVAKDDHGTPNFELLLNIDGQAVLLRGNLQKENSALRGPSAHETGDGIRYLFNKNLRLKSGIHEVFVAIPEDGIAVKKKIILSEGNLNHLVMEPIYNGNKKSGKNPEERRPGARIETSFKEGIKGVRLTLNGREI